MRRKQRLALSAAEKILATFGPDDGQVMEPETGLVIASESVVAHDMVSLAWLLENRRTGPPAGAGALEDPYSSQLFVSIGNHWVVNKLDGLESALASERLTRNEITSIWHDRVFRCAYEVLGGVPLATLAAANSALPDELTERLGAMTTPAASWPPTPKAEVLQYPAQPSRRPGAGSAPASVTRGNPSETPGGPDR